jgi:hypothetical protein
MTAIPSPMVGLNDVADIEGVPQSVGALKVCYP